MTRDYDPNDDGRPSAGTAAQIEKYLAPLRGRRLFARPWNQVADPTEITIGHIIRKVSLFFEVRITTASPCHTSERFLVPGIKVLEVLYIQETPYSARGYTNTEYVYALPAEQIGQADER